MWVIDFESSGLSKKSYPIEVGLTDGLHSKSFLIKPMKHWNYWSNDAAIIHGITRESLDTEGTEALDVAIYLNDKLQNSRVYCDSENWDGFWLNVLFSDNGSSPSFELTDIVHILDTGEALEKYLKSKDNLTNSGRYTPHRALDDVKIIFHSLSEALKE
jgi:hypothetical protein